MTEEFRQQWLEAMQEYSKALEVEDDSVEIITNPSDVDSSVSMPAVKLDADGRVEKYVQIRYATLAAAISNAQTLLGQIDADATALRTTIQTLQEEARQAQEIIDDLDGVGEQVEQLGQAISQANKLITQLNTALQTAASDHATAQADHTVASSDHTVASSDHETAASDHTKVQGAENVNAELNGITVTITNRSGQSKSVDIGFDIYRTYTSVAAMNADASNVPLGKFVMIATTDKTSAENARMYIKSSHGNFRFLCDLDQASAEAWADWLDNMKPQIEDATDAANAAADRVDDCISTANQDHTRAETDHTTATSDHSTAQEDHTTAESDHTQAVSDTQRASTDHTTADSDHDTATADHTTASADHTTAVQDNSNATSDHSTAQEDHTTAESDHTRAEGEHIRAEEDHTTATDDHTQAGTDHQTFITNEEQRQSDFDDAQAERNTTWTSWFSDSLSTGVRKLWDDFWSNINSSWNGFFGTSADDPNGVRKIWSSWYSSVQSSWNAFWPAAKNTWESWFGTSSSTGVQGEWADLKSDAEQDHTTATSDHTIASSDHTQAVADHTTAGTDHGVAESDHTQATNDHTASVAATTHANEEGDRAENLNDHPAYIGNDNYWYLWDYTTQAYVRSNYAKGDNLDWESMTPAEKQALADEVLAEIGFDDVPTANSDNAVKSGGLYTEFQRVDTAIGGKQDTLTFATVETCGAIIDELT